MSEQQLRSSCQTCLHLKNLKFFLVFEDQKNIFGTSNATNEEVH